MAQRFFDEIEKFIDFVLVPDNSDNYKRNIGNCYNIYEPIKFTPEKGEFKMTEIFLEHIFGTYLNVGLDYLTILFKKPAEKLPALCLVSREQKTGKSHSCTGYRKFMAITPLFSGTKISVLILIPPGQQIGNWA